MSDDETNQPDIDALRGDGEGGLDDTTLAVLAALVIRCGGAVELPSTEFNKYYELDVQWSPKRASFQLMASRSDLPPEKPSETSH
jgi:hypothetical protein